MSVNVYKSTDASAPVLTGSAGSLIAVLDGCLVNGYGSKSPAGWTKPFSGTNTAVYRQPVPPNSNGFYLNVSDTANDYTTVYGCEVSTGVGTGTAFPTGGCQFHKGGVTSTRRWDLVATQKTFYLYMNTSNSNPPVSGVINMFGDITSHVPGDAYHTMIVGGANSQQYFASLTTTLNTTYSGHAMARSYTQTGGGILVGKFSDGSVPAHAFCSGNLSGKSSFPEPINQSLIFSPVFVHQQATTGPVRGVLPGIWNCINASQNSFTHGNQITGTGTLAGKILEAWKPQEPTYGVPSVVFVEISDTW